MDYRHESAYQPYDPQASAMLTPEAIDTVRQRLQNHAHKGVLQGFGEQPGRRGKTRFRFRWLLGHEFSLAVDPVKQQLVFENLLPAVENRSFMDSDLRRFVAGRTNDALPEHRRLDTERVSLSYTNRKQNVSLIMWVHDNQCAYAIKALFTTLNDLFAYLHLYHIDYLHRNFGLPEE